jgi:hypothetical protein
MDHLGQRQGFKISHETLKLASRYLDPNEHLGQSWQTQKPWGWPRYFMARMRLLGQAQGSCVSLETLKFASMCLDQPEGF